MIGMLFAVSPALIGALLVMVFMRGPNFSAWLRRISAAAGMLLGELLFACLLLLTRKVGIDLLTHWTLFILAMLLGVLVSTSLSQMYRKVQGVSLTRTLLQNSDWVFVTVIWGFLTLLWNHPVFGWDTSSVWAHNAVYYIQTINNSAVEGSELYDVASKHPPTLSLLLAWSGWLAANFKTSAPVIALGMLPWVIMSLSLFGLGLYLGLGRWLLVWASYGLLVLPLLENHYLVTGYAEAWLAALLLLMAIAVGIAINSKSWNWIFLIFLASPLLSIFKYGGFLFAIVFALSLGLAYLYVNIASKKMSVFASASGVYAIILTSALLFIGIPFVEHVLKDQFNINIGGVANPVAEGLMLNDPLVVLVNEVHSLLLNASFSIMFLVLVVLTANFFRDTRAGELELLYMTFNMILPWAALAVPVTFQLVSEYGLYYGLPGRDTGNSRLSIVFVPLVINFLIVSFVGCRSQRCST